MEISIIMEKLRQKELHSPRAFDRICFQTGIPESSRLVNYQARTPKFQRNFSIQTFTISVRTHGRESNSCSHQGYLLIFKTQISHLIIIGIKIYLIYRLRMFTEEPFTKDIASRATNNLRRATHLLQMYRRLDKKDIIYLFISSRSP